MDGSGIPSERARDVGWRGGCTRACACCVGTGDRRALRAPLPRRAGDAPQHCACRPSRVPAPLVQGLRQGEQGAPGGGAARDASGIREAAACCVVATAHLLCCHPFPAACLVPPTPAAASLLLLSPLPSPLLRQDKYHGLAACAIRIAARRASPGVAAPLVFSDATAVLRSLEKWATATAATAAAAHPTAAASTPAGLPAADTPEAAPGVASVVMLQVR